MLAATQQPLIERRRATWCPGATPWQPGLSLPDQAVLAPHEPDLAATHPNLRLKIEEAIAMGFDIQPELLSFPSRGRADVALARQVSMYIANVCLGFSLTQVGKLFDRDRTTVAHACEVVEQLRDDDAFDLAITQLERGIRITYGVPGRMNGVTMPRPSSYGNRKRCGGA
jgi:Bacterial dnaA protein helix-turn-helix